MNEVNLTGRVEEEIELKKFDDGNSYCSVSIATDKSWENKESGEWETKTTKHQVFFSRALAESISNAINEGDLIRIKAELDYQEIEESNKRAVVLRGINFQRYHRPKDE